ncbi:MAG: hypothetical protein AB9882_04700 [Ignavibacteriaceae bacterium]
MKTKFLLIFIIFLTVSAIQAQGRRNAFRKIDQIDLVKLLDVLNMDEQTSTKFLPKRKAFVEKRRESVIKLDSLEKFIDKGIKEDKAGSNVVKKAINEYIELEKYIFTLRYDHLNSVKSLLTTEQLANYLQFDRKFKQELRDIIRENKRMGRRNN